MTLYPPTDNPGHGGLDSLCAWHGVVMSGAVGGRVKGGKQSSTQRSVLMIYWEAKACGESLSRPDKD